MRMTKLRANLLVFLFIIHLAGCGSAGSSKNGGAIDTSLLQYLSITPANTALAKGTSQRLTAIGIYIDDTAGDLTSSVNWSSSDTTRATISDTGEITGLSAGPVTITASLGSISTNTAITITDATLVSVAVIPTNPSIATGTTRQLTATGTYSDNTTQDLTAAVTWSSSNTNVAAVSNSAGSKGLAAAVVAGATTITAATGSVSGTAVLTVTGTGAVTLTWDAPTSYTDGTAATLAAVSGYNIYYGTSSGSYTTMVNVASHGTTPVTYTLNLTPGTYYFAVTAICTDGSESVYSNEISTTI